MRPRLPTTFRSSSSAMSRPTASPAGSPPKNVRRAIVREFRNFLVTYVDENGVSVYGQRIKTLGETNAESLEISFLHLVDSKAILAYFLANSPASMLPI